jgi:hypothetical protein
LGEKVNDLGGGMVGIFSLSQSILIFPDLLHKVDVLFFLGPYTLGYFCLTFDMVSERLTQVSMFRGGVTDFAGFGAHCTDRLDSTFHRSSLFMSLCTLKNTKAGVLFFRLLDVYCQKKNEVWQIYLSHSPIL